MDIDLSGKRAFVTAGASGIGLATAQALKAVGAEVIVCDVDEVALAACADNFQGYRCDVSDEAAVDRIMTQVMIRDLDILVNNAGIAGPTAALEEITYGDWQKTLAVCLDSQFLFSRRVLPQMKARRSGLIVNVSSTAGIAGFPNRSPYAAAKWAVVGLTKTMAMETGRFNIRVNAIAPGSVTGERMERVVAAYAEAEKITPEEVTRLFNLGVSMGNFVEAEDIGAMVVYLASKYGRHISGQVLCVDGHTETLFPRI
jgi:NAD(P)-dependent dehydrogenase (short-subunit alcohol dehydrogenase family)